MDEELRGPSVEAYEKILEVRFLGVKKESLSKGGNFNFVVTPEYNILVAQQFHHHIAKRHGIDQNTTLTEGYVRIHAGKPLEVIFKGEYQPRRAFEGTALEFDMFKRAVQRKLVGQLRP